MRVCTKCKQNLDLKFFGKNSFYKDGIHKICKECATKQNYAWREKNRDKYLSGLSKWRENNKEKHLQSFRNWREKNKELHVKKVIDWQKLNPEKFKLTHDNWRKNNKHVLGRISAARRAICKNATPRWANKFFMQEIYHLARLRSELTGFMWHVDHVIPLKGKNVCGFHVETNMQVIPWFENVKKSNKF